MFTCKAGSTVSASEIIQRKVNPCNPRAGYRPAQDSSATVEKRSHYTSHHFKKGSALNAKGREGGKKGREKRRGLALNCGFRPSQKKNTLEQIKTRYSLSLEKHIGKNLKKIIFHFIISLVY